MAFWRRGTEEPRALPQAAPFRSLRGPWWQRGAQAVLQALWVGIVPTLLSVLVLRRCVPPVASGAAGVVATFVNQFELPVGVGLFFVFSLLARYWRFRVPGGRTASRLPAHLVPEETDPESLSQWASFAALYEIFASPRMQRRLRRAFDPATVASVEREVLALGDGLERGDWTAARNAASALDSRAAGPLASVRTREALGVAGAAVVAALSALGLRGLVQPYRVLSASMVPTLEPDDLVVANRRAYRSYRGGAESAKALPRRGDLVLFRSDAVPLDRAGPELLVKRVLGLPGDHLSMAGDVPIINGWMVPFCDAGKYLYVSPEGDPLHGKVRVEFLEDRAYLTLQSLWRPFDGTYVVKPGEVFVLGDSRSNSVDSRAWNEGQGGGVPLEAVAGRAEWFLLGRLRSGDLDAGRWLRRLDALTPAPHIEGPEGQQLKEGIARCLKKPPAVTRPPEPPRNAEGSRPTGDRGA